MRAAMWRMKPLIRAPMSGRKIKRLMKIVAIFISLLIFLPLMGALMSGFMRHIAARIAAM